MAKEAEPWWVTVQEAARLLSKSERTIRRMAKDSRLPSRREGARLFLDVSGVAVPDEIDVLDMSDVDALKAEIASLRKQLDMVTEDRDYLRGALAEALRLRRPAIQGPRRSLRERVEGLFGRRD